MIFKQCADAGARGLGTRPQTDFFLLIRPFFDVLVYRMKSLLRNKIWFLERFFFRRVL